jgi:hypothetical protein
VKQIMKVMCVTFAAGLGAWTILTISSQNPVKADLPQGISVPDTVQVAQNEPMPMLSETNLKAASVERYNEHAAKFDSENTDSSWAARKETRIAARFDQFKISYNLTGNISSLKCHLTMCKLKFTFSTQEVGVRELKKFISSLSAIEGCGFFFSALPPEDNGNTKYETEAFLLCETQRTGDTSELQ